MVGAILTERALGFLVGMVDAAGPDDLPSSLVDRCERANALVKRCKPYGELESTQVLASIVEQWMRDTDDA